MTSKFKTRLLMESSCWLNENGMVKLWTEVCCGVCWACCLICRWVQRTLLVTATFRNRVWTFLICVLCRSNSILLVNVLQNLTIRLVMLPFLYPMHNLSFSVNETSLPVFKWRSDLQTLCKSFSACNILSVLITGFGILGWLNVATKKDHVCPDPGSVSQKHHCIGNFLAEIPRTEWDAKLRQTFSNR